MWRSSPLFIQYRIEAICDEHNIINYPDGSTDTDVTCRKTNYIFDSVKLVIEVYRLDIICFILISLNQINSILCA